FLDHHHGVVALVASLPSEQLAVGTGYAQLVRSLGQLGGLSAASAVFQSRLTTELQERIQRPDAEEVLSIQSFVFDTIFTLPFNSILSR
ncbi:hypothetical protein H0H93_003647, partial [Arthromyces matolae]